MAAQLLRFVLIKPVQPGLSAFPERGLDDGQGVEGALAGGSLALLDGALPANGAGVDLKTCQPDRFKGDVQLSTSWTDPTFNPKQRAFYYVRVLEIPTPRWNTYDAVRQQMAPLTKVPATIQERAWSSPIWYVPGQ